MVYQSAMWAVHNNVNDFYQYQSCEHTNKHRTVGSVNWPKYEIRDEANPRYPPCPSDLFDHWFLPLLID